MPVSDLLWFAVSSLWIPGAPSVRCYACGLLNYTHETLYHSDFFYVKIPLSSQNLSHLRQGHSFSFTHISDLPFL